MPASKAAYALADRLRFWLNRLGERLWVRPLVVCLLSIAAVFLAKWLEGTAVDDYLPDVGRASVEALLSTLSASMLVIATFCVGSMVSAYASAASTATPRSFNLVIADDVSQNALATFVGAFIFSIVGIVTAKSEYFSAGGYFILFCLTLLVFALVVFTFIRWVDRIARLGRIGPTIEKIEQATHKSLQNYRLRPHLGGSPLASEETFLTPLLADKVGYVMRVDLALLQKQAERLGCHIRINAMPGDLVITDKPLAWWVGKLKEAEIDQEACRKAFVVGKARTFDEDPYFGLMTLSQIAMKALSPAVNDPGTAVDVLSSQLRLLVQFTQPTNEEETSPILFARVQVPPLSSDRLLDNAFSGIARDGASSIEVVRMLLLCLETLVQSERDDIRQSALMLTHKVLAHAKKNLTLEEEIQQVQKDADFLEH
ncbi:DUF2254 domain-containing protein [Aliiglaciecola sp. CAU 1673]|uniref:DUF2254 domain-containing protein n=1 Tax=Aliiglaciecola sp. CAU 1673 TaxID=3032595 RepID=UPI0023DB3712|nr:DUF2254 domain-containing protein [Aliiglaciecola sp. CAU 1673]MDF2179450.1 DUF2254 domain-containing protein [Aliiglaciecola sp. CAU 1673]